MEGDNFHDALPHASASSGEVASGLNAVSVKPSPFWKGNPVLWFTLMEAQFESAHITADRTKYFSVLSALDETMFCVVSDIVTNPPVDGKYEALKQGLIARLSKSENQKLHQLLNEMVLGDSLPSQFLREMKALNNSKLSDAVMKTLWLQRLPSNVQAILSCHPGSLDELSACADKIVEVVPSSQICSVRPSSSGQSPSELEILSKKVDALTKLVEIQLRLGHQNKRGHFRSDSKDKARFSRERSTSKGKFCWYHTKFGKKASKCISPCSFATISSLENNSGN